jgi:RNA recognition motif-containing protein
MNLDGTSKGFGYVWYRERANAAEAIKQLNGKQYAGKEIRVAIFVEKV